jgi:large subunit ribosomal protein L2
MVIRRQYNKGNKVILPVIHLWNRFKGKRVVDQTKSYQVFPFTWSLHRHSLRQHYFSIVRPEFIGKNKIKRRQKLLKRLSISIKSSAGRSSVDGHITVRHRGGGHKRRYRVIDFFRAILDIPAIILRVERDPIRKAFIALVCYSNGILSYIIQPHNLDTGKVFISSLAWLPPDIGNAMPLKYIPIGTLVHNIQITPHSVGSIVRSAGTSAQILKKTSTHTLIKLPSTELRYILSSSLATIGMVSNPQYKFEKLEKAGQSRWLGRRPSVRGVAMNPIDHPHGGGQGKTSGGRPSVSLWARLTKGFKTVRNKNPLVFKSRLKV